MIIAKINTTTHFFITIITKGFAAIKTVPRCLYLRVIKILIIFAYVILFSYIRFRIDSRYHKRKEWKRVVKSMWTHISLIDIAYKKNMCLTYQGYRSNLSCLFNEFMFVAWFFEKTGVNFKINYENLIFQYFENNILINNPKKKHEKFIIVDRYMEPKKALLGMFFISSEYGYKILSKLSLKEDIKKIADTWFDEHIEGDLVAVHYRGTDIFVQRKERYKFRYKIELDSYIDYLKEVLDNQCNIFVCSDQAQFVNKMRTHFQGRVFARDIERSYTHERIHKDILNCKKFKAKDLIRAKDALIDILILAKAPLIYTTGSGFVDIVRYFNPNTRIVSMDERKIGRGENYLPIPRKDLFDKLRIQ